MLKIRDDVDLKELEEFGFRDEKDYFKKNDDEEIIFVYKSDRSIAVDSIGYDYIYSIAGLPLDLLFDLFEAGLVEKVKD